MRLPLRVALRVLLALTATVLGRPAVAAPQVDNVILVMIDGLRWEEVFRGADPALMDEETGGVHHEDTLREQFWRDTPEERRAALLPFIWGTVAAQGQLVGNQDAGSVGRIHNGRNYSYPGYAEILSGFVDPAIVDNTPVPNPNATVFEWVHNQPGFDGRVAAFAAWGVFPAIFNRERAGFLINAGFEPLALSPSTPELDTLDRLKGDLTRLWPLEPPDAVTAATARAYVELKQPRLLFLSLGESDEWAHAGRYDLYLEAAWRADRTIAELWRTVQAMPAYRDRTALIIATDHGRGPPPTLWRSHGADKPGSEFTWYAFMGPGVPATGAWSGGPEVAQGQVAATIAALLGLDYGAAEPRAGAPIEAVLTR